jgi:gamma-glutamylcyclotransferase (GGCT)/AIG2-like uncharacterized protein YtfP
MVCGTRVQVDAESGSVPSVTGDADALAEASTLGPQHRLATYGTLSPGRPNHHQLTTLKGRWSRGYVHGRLVAAGWGADLGFPAIVLGPDGPQVDVEVFESHELPDHWDRLDQFEGAGYARVVTTVHTASGDVQASIYVLVAPAQH